MIMTVMQALRQVRFRGFGFCRYPEPYAQIQVSIRPAVRAINDVLTVALHRGFTWWLCYGCPNMTA